MAISSRWESIAGVIRAMMMIKAAMEMTMRKVNGGFAGLGVPFRTAKDEGPLRTMKTATMETNVMKIPNRDKEEEPVDKVLIVNSDVDSVD